MPASDKRKAARAAKALADRNAAPDANSTLDKDILDELPAHEDREDYQYNMAAMFNQFVGLMKDKNKPVFDQLTHLLQNREIPKGATGTDIPRSKVTKQKGKQKAAEQDSQHNTAAGSSSSKTITFNQFLTAVEDEATNGEEDSDTEHLVNFIRQYKISTGASGTALPRFKATKQKSKMKAAGQSSHGNTAAGPSTSDTTTQKDSHKAAGQPSTDNPTCFAPRWRRMQASIRSKAMHQNRRKKVVRENSQVSAAAAPSGHNSSDELTQSTTGVTTAGSAEPRGSKHISAGRYSKDSTIASSSKTAPPPMLTHDPNEPRRNYDPSMKNGSM